MFCSIYERIWQNIKKTSYQLIDLPTMHTLDIKNKPPRKDFYWLRSNNQLLTIAKPESQSHEKSWGMKKGKQLSRNEKRKQFSKRRDGVSGHAWPLEEISGRKKHKKSERQREEREKRNIIYIYVYIYINR